MTVVFDTNTLISAAIFPASVPGKCLFDFILLIKIINSTPAIEELDEVIYRKKFDKYLSNEEKDRVLSSFRRMSNVVNTTSIIADCRDPKDNKFLELAIDGNADYIITGDPDLLILHPYRGISIVTPAQFLSILINEK